VFKEILSPFGAGIFVGDSIYENVLGTAATQDSLSILRWIRVQSAPV
jgi:hypothetical protein